MKDLKPNTGDFVQITRAYLKAQRELAKTSTPAWMMLSFLMERMNRANSVVVSQAALAELLGFTRPTISKATALLVKQKWVEVTKIGTAYAYTVNSKVAWRGKPGHRFAVFNAAVVTVESEQEKNNFKNPEKDYELQNIPIVRKKDLLIDDGADTEPPDQKDMFDPSHEEIPVSGMDEEFIHPDDMKELTEQEILELRYGQTRLPIEDDDDE